jgi:hypothetical protein
MYIRNIIHVITWPFIDNFPASVCFLWKAASILKEKVHMHKFAEIAWQVCTSGSSFSRVSLITYLLARVWLCLLLLIFRDSSLKTTKNKQISFQRRVKECIMERLLSNLVMWMFCQSCQIGRNFAAWEKIPNLPKRDSILMQFVQPLQHCTNF